MQTKVGQGLSPSVLRQLVSGSAQNLLPGRLGDDLPPEPFRQLWYAAAQQTLLAGALVRRGFEVSMVVFDYGQADRCFDVIRAVSPDQAQALRDLAERFDR